MSHMSSLPNRDLDRVQSVIIAAAHLIRLERSDTSTSRRCCRTYTDYVCLKINLRVARSCIQHYCLSPRSGAMLPTRRHPARRCNVAPLSAVDIFVRPGGSDNATNYDRRPSFCRRGTSCMEQSSPIRH